jgi:hypothetical protein
MNDRHHDHHHHHGHHHHEHHHAVRGQSQLVWPQYSQGLMLQDDDLTQAVDYARELSQLLFRSLLGCGVVCGLEVRLHFDGCHATLGIAPGVALDATGQPVHVPEHQTIQLGKHDGDLSRPHWIVIRRQEQSFMPRGLASNPEDDAGSTVYTRKRDGFEIRLVDEEDRKGACGCAVPGAGNDNAAARQDCFALHLQGASDCGCSSAWVVLGYFASINQARELPEARKDGVSADHRVRRFIRPALLEDPLWGNAVAPGTAGTLPAAPAAGPDPEPAKAGEAAEADGGAKAAATPAADGAEAGAAPETPDQSSQ